MVDDRREPEAEDALDADRDAGLIMDYLASRLGRDEAIRVEDRVRIDEGFRQKFADVVLLKGLVLAATALPPASGAGSCRSTRKLFASYRRGRTSPSETAALSSHLDDCLDCETEFASMSAARLAKPQRRGWVVSWKGLLHSLLGRGRRAKPKKAT